jgi:hypothetical protein
MPKTPAVVDGRERHRGGFEAAAPLDQALPERRKGCFKNRRIPLANSLSWPKAGI